MKDGFRSVAEPGAPPNRRRRASSTPARLGQRSGMTPERLALRGESDGSPCRDRPDAAAATRCPARLVEHQVTLGTVVRPSATSSRSIIAEHVIPEERTRPGSRHQRERFPMVPVDPTGRQRRICDLEERPVAPRPIRYLRAGQEQHERQRPLNSATGEQPKDDVLVFAGHRSAALIANADKHHGRHRSGRPISIGPATACASAPRCTLNLGR